MAELTVKQQAFVEYYLIYWNASEAARRAGYASKANVIGSQLLANPSIASRVQARLADMKATADEVIVRLTDHARGSLDDFINENKEIDLDRARAAGKMHLLKKYKITKRTIKDVTEETVEIELHDPQSATVHLGRVHGVFLDRTDMTSGGEKIPIAVVKMDIDAL